MAIAPVRGTWFAKKNTNDLTQIDAEERVSRTFAPILIARFLRLDIHDPIGYAWRNRTISFHRNGLNPGG